MLVTTLKRGIRRLITGRREGDDTRPVDDRGATLVIVLVVMLVLGVAAMTTATVVVNTTVGLGHSRETAQSRAAADAGMAVAVAKARRTGAFCGMDITTTTAPQYKVTSTCTSTQVTFTSVGKGVGGGETTAVSVYGYSAGSTGGGADMVFFSNVTFTAEVKTNTLTDGLLSIVIPSGDFVCQSAVPANIIVKGNLQTNGGCTIEGGVVAGGNASMCCGADTIKGGVSAAGTGTANIQGTIGGDLKVGGGIGFGWNNKQIGGNVEAQGDVSLGSSKLMKSLTIPNGKNVSMQSGSIAGGVLKPTTVTKPTVPTFDPWFEYKYKASDWQPYKGTNFSVITLVNSGDGSWTCNRFNANNPNTVQAKGWRDLGELTTPTIVDARACSNLSSNNGTSPNVALRTDIVLLAKQFDLTSLTFRSQTGYDPRVWFIVEDTTNNGSPTCSSGNVGVNHTNVVDITAMIYTPCQVNVQGNSKWTGSFYGGSFNYGGGMDFYGDPIALPGMPETTTSPGNGPSTASALGAVVSQRDVP